ncbi:MAG: uncharacterized protein KVP18_000076 [Porospora cf. gigantea A]|uniref:uncharacterized protein n=1 Tax=Porospora cf. gigantea A TaxID=2853593 RepID=UPI00355A9C60|nr:MAG: hypothetical protein KVP18_000076 [Porospora cf. gigantea A]
MALSRLTGLLHQCTNDSAQNDNFKIHYRRLLKIEEVLHRQQREKQVLLQQISQDLSASENEDVSDDSPKPITSTKLIEDPQLPQCPRCGWTANDLPIPMPSCSTTLDACRDPGDWHVRRYRQRNKQRWAAALVDCVEFPPPEDVADLYASGSVDIHYDAVTVTALKELDAIQADESESPCGSAHSSKEVPAHKTAALRQFNDTMLPVQLEAQHNAQAQLLQDASSASPNPVPTIPPTPPTDTSDTEAMDICQIDFATCPKEIVDCLKEFFCLKPKGLNTRRILSDIQTYLNDPTNYVSTTDLTQKRAAVRGPEVWRTAIRENEVLWERLLLFEDVALEEIKRFLVHSLNERIGNASLKRFLEQEGVHFATPN